MLVLLFIMSCMSDGMLTYEKEVEVYVEVESECEVIEDTDYDFSDLWVDSFVQIRSLDGVDIFWVIDPSGSMFDDQPAILAGIQLMMSSLPAVGWRLMIIPSDYREVTNLTSFPIVPGDTIADVEAMYNDHVNGNYEAGFDAVIEYIDFNQYANTWLRDDAALLIVFVSDENDQSREHVANEFEFINWALMQRSHTFVASIINLPNDVSECTSNVPMQNVGERYVNATNYFGGNIVDICSEDWSAGVAQAADQVVPYEWIDLTHVPLDPNWIYVYIDGILNRDWTYDATLNRVEFTVIPTGNSLVEVVYNY